VENAFLRERTDHLEGSVRSLTGELVDKRDLLHHVSSALAPEMLSIVIYLSVYLSVYLSIYIYLSIYLCIYLCLFLSSSSYPYIYVSTRTHAQTR